MVVTANVRVPETFSDRLLAHDIFTSEPALTDAFEAKANVKTSLVSGTLLLKPVVQDTVTAPPWDTVVSASSVMISISLTSGTPVTSDDAGAFGEPAPTFTVQVAEVEEKTSESVVIVILSPDERADVDVKLIFSAPGLLDILVRPFTTKPTTTIHQYPQ